jgi:hypothetical protein
MADPKGHRGTTIASREAPSSRGGGNAFEHKRYYSVLGCVGDGAETMPRRCASTATSTR